ncbi:MAG: DUF6247 family protein [Pseudonocardiaceae bacterium]
MSVSAALNGEGNGYRYCPVAAPHGIRAALLREYRAVFDAAYEAALAEARTVWM